MPNWKVLNQFVSYVHSQNIKDYDQDEATLGNLIDPNFEDIKAIKEDNALRQFKDKMKYDRITVTDAYKSAKHLGLVQRRDSENSTHVQGVAIIVTEEGKEFIGTRMGKWHIIIRYYASWSLVIALGSLIISIIAIVVAIFKD